MSMLRSRLTLANTMSAAAVWALAACSATAPSPSPPAQLTALPRELTPAEQNIAEAANQFTFTLFRRLNEQQPTNNVFLSPLSVSFSLGMAMNGAAGTTLDQMRATLGFGAEEITAINSGYKGLLGLQAGLDPSTTFDIANSIWYRQTFSFKSSFITTVQQSFDASAHPTPFDGTTLKQVNDWVSANTNGKITKILDQISPLDVMFLINAIYFKGSWRDGFDPARTTDGPFTLLDGSTQTAKFMSRREGEGKIRYGYRDGTVVGELAYGNGAFVMTIVLPPPDKTINDVAAALDTTAWQSHIESMRETDFAVVLPRFRVEYDRELSKDLTALGMQDPFVPERANFSNMTSADVFISFVQHKAYVNVDEEGTEAAAVTNTGIRTVSLPPTLLVNRPFIFAIRERFSGTILFIGKIARIPA